MRESDELLDVLIDSNGSCRQISDQDTEKAAGLPSLLAEGWQPIRETALHARPSIPS